MPTFSCFSSTSPVRVELLVAFCDLTNFARVAAPSFTDEGLYSFLDSYYEFTGKIIEEAGGMVIKFIGDAALIIFPADKIDAGVIALRQLREEGDQWMRDRNLPCRNILKMHFGTVAAGKVGTKDNKRPDVLGQTVNIAAMTPSKGFAMTAQVFRKLSKETRTFFKKHAPPMTYIPVEAPHKD